MTNVLPLEAQKELWRAHRARFLAVFSIAGIVLGFIAALALVPSFVALEMNTQSPDQSSEQSSTKEGMRALARAQAQIGIVLPILTATSSPVSVVEQAIAMRPKGVTVDRVRYTGGSQKQQIQLGGKASREALTAYRTALEASKLFSSVSVPVGALFGDTGTFSITLTGTF